MIAFQFEVIERHFTTFAALAALITAMPPGDDVEGSV
jgi:hypothetical protein